MGFYVYFQGTFLVSVGEAVAFGNSSVGEGQVEVRSDSDTHRASATGCLY